MKTCLPNEHGIFSYSINNQSCLAIAKNGHYYEIKPGNFIDSYFVKHKEIVYLNDAYYERTAEAAEEIVYSSCNVRRSPPDSKSTCVRFSSGLQQILDENLDKGFTANELKEIRQSDINPAIYIDEKGNQFLNYRGYFFKLKKNKEEFNVEGKKAFKFIPHLMTKKIATISFSPKNGKFHLATSVECLAEKLNISPEEAQLKLLHSEAEPPLTPTEKLALYNYGTESYMINEYLRGHITRENIEENYGWSGVLEVEKQIDKLRSGLEKIPAYQGVVYRGAHIPKEDMIGLQIGDVLSNKSFLSSSAREDIATQYADFPLLSTHEKIMFKIHLKRNGRYITHLIPHIHSEEVLIKEGTLFRYAGRKGNVIELYEVEEDIEGIDDSSPGASQSNEEKIDKTTVKFIL